MKKKMVASSFTGFTVDDLLVVDIVLYMPRAAGDFSSTCSIKANRPISPNTSKNDLDNLAKPVLDGMTDVGLWADDGQVINMTIKKRFHPQNKVGGYVSVRSVSCIGVYLPKFWYFDHKITKIKLKYPKGLKSMGKKGPNNGKS
jgi:Holliday junction resolvase RusA-like endonuclease